MPARQRQSASRVFFVADDVLPQTIDVVQTRAKPLGIEVRVAAAGELAAIDCFGALVQYPGVDGDVRDYAPLAASSTPRARCWSRPPTCSRSRC